MLIAALERGDAIATVATTAVATTAIAATTTITAAAAVAVAGQAAVIGATTAAQRVLANVASAEDEQRDKQQAVAKPHSNVFAGIGPLRKEVMHVRLLVEANPD